MPDRKAHSAQMGFSLIEILVSALVTLILGSMGFYFLSTQNWISANSNDMVKGVSIGKQKMDSLKVVAYDELTSGSDTVQERYIRAWHVTVMRDPSGNPNGRKKIDVSVHWPLTAINNIALATVKSDDRFKEEGP
jgi:hypothetical protein